MKTAEMQVSLLDYMGTDLTVVNAARVSFDKESKWEQEDQLDPLKLSEKDAKLINYLAKHNHWTTFGHCFAQFRIKAPIFVARQLVKHCVTGDTLVSFRKLVNGKPNGNSYKTIEHLYNMWSGTVKYQGGKKGKLNVSNGHVKCYNEDTKEFTSSHITDVLYQGEKEVYLLKTEHNHSVKITKDHQVLTNRGWIPIEEIVIGTDFIVNDTYGELVNSTHSHRDKNSDDVIARRNIIKERCAICNSSIGLEVDHIIPVNVGGTNDIDNLQVLCHVCHRSKTNKEAKISHSTFKPKYTKIISIESIGIEKVYDITVDTYHNFLANGLVVHNCVGLVWNEVSRRYVDYEPEFWFPDTWRGRPTGSMKQGSSGALEDQFHIVRWAENSCIEALNTYNELLEMGVAPEQARMVLPLNSMTEWYWSGSLAAWARVCKLRLDPHAQEETREIAVKINEHMQNIFPVAWKALMS